MDYNLLFGLLLILPCAGGAICTMLPTPWRIMAAMCATVFACPVIMMPIVWRVIAGGPVEAVGGLFYVDALSAYHLCVMSIVFVASSIYAWQYFMREANSGHVTKRSLRQYAGLWCGALAAMTLVLISNNLGIMWVGIEATTLLTAFLICIPVKPSSLEAMWKYLMICFDRRSVRLLSER
jgi:hydrogenase-4 component F